MGRGERSLCLRKFLLGGCQGAPGFVQLLHSGGVVAAGAGEAATDVFKVAARFFQLVSRCGQGALGGVFALLEVSDAVLVVVVVVVV